MNKLICHFCVFLLFPFAAFAQGPPEGINYQAIARDVSGKELINKTISLRFSIRTNTTTGIIAYQETHVQVTNSFGLFTVIIGKGLVVTGNFSLINWGGGLHFLEVELDPNGGNNYTSIGTTQFMSVPYALYAKNAQNAAPGINCWDLNGDKIKDLNEDINKDAIWDALDCKGDSGMAGPRGIPGLNGLNCWDVDGDNIKDPGEDINGDLKWDALDCKPVIPVVFPTGSTAQTIRHDGTNWIANGFLSNNGNTVTVNNSTPDPNAKLDVKGKVKIADGTEGLGKVLTSDATGLSSWQTSTSTPKPTIAFRALAKPPISFLGTNIKADFATEIFDVGAGFNPTTSEYTVPLDGIYYVGATCTIMNNSAGNGVKLSITVNGTALNSSYMVNESTSTLNLPESCIISGVYQLTAGDKITILISASGGPTALSSVSEHSWFCAYRIN